MRRSLKTKTWVIVMVLLLVGIVLLLGCAPTETFYAQSTPVALHPNRYIDSEYGVVCYAWNGQLDCVKYK